MFLHHPHDDDDDDDDTGGDVDDGDDDDDSVQETLQWGFDINQSLANKKEDKPSLREVVKKKPGYFTVRLTVRVDPLPPLTVSFSWIF